MTAPAGLAEVTAQIAALQAQIDSLSTPSTVTDPSSASNFASALSDAGSDPTALPTTSTTTAASAYAVPATTTAAGTTATPSASGPTGADVVADAKQYLGIPYVWGGESTSGLDCSGLVQKTFGDLGISLPRVAADQAHSGTPVASLADAQPGDLLFFGNPAYHVAIYAGNNQLIESPEPGKTVHITDVYQTPTSIRRIVPDAATSPMTASAMTTAPLTTTATASTGSGLSAAQLTAAGVNPAVATFANQFATAEQTYGLPTGLLAAVAQQESGGNPNAVSPAGAQGLMQLMPSTAASQGVNAFDPSQAITAAARIFKANLAQFHGSVPLALAAYNAGAGAVSQYGGIPPYSETQNYVRKIMATLGAGG
jgi:peptidoglycan DL-endopeptidase CwlO